MEFQKNFCSYRRLLLVETDCGVDSSLLTSFVFEAAEMRWILRQWHRLRRGRDGIFLVIRKASRIKGGLGLSLQLEGDLWECLHDMLLSWGLTGLLFYEQFLICKRVFMIFFVTNPFLALFISTIPTWPGWHNYITTFLRWHALNFLLITLFCILLVLLYNDNFRKSKKEHVLKLILTNIWFFRIFKTLKITNFTLNCIPIEYILTVWSLFVC